MASTGGSPTLTTSTAVGAPWRVALRAFVGLWNAGRAGEDVAPILAAAERSGFRLLLLGRTAVLMLLLVWQLYALSIHGNPTGALLVGVLLAAGLLVLSTLKTRYERRWHRFALVGLDVVAITLAACTLPLLLNAEVPRILLFRAYGTHLMPLLLIVTALSLMPALVLFTGLALTAGYWAVVSAIVAEQERLVSWSDLGDSPSPVQYVNLLMDVDFINWAQRFEETAALLLATLLLALAVGRARRAVQAFAQAERGRRRAEEIFGHFVPADVADRILSQPDVLSPRVQEATVLFLDIEGFTAFSEGREASVVMLALDRFFSDAARHVADQGGTALGFAGDAMLATFGVPRGNPRPAAAAVAAARFLLDRCESATYDGVCFKLRIGVASGPLAAGAIGESRRSYTVYGDTVNMAQRLEEANKRTGSRLLVCEATWTQAGQPQDFAAVGPIAVEGRSQTIDAYALN